MTEIALKVALGVPVRRRMNAYLLSLVVASATVGVFLVLAGEQVGNLWALAALSAAAAVAQRGRVDLGGTLASISTFPVLLAAVLFGPLAAMIVAASSMLGEGLVPYTRWASYTVSRSLTGAAAGLIALALRGVAHAELSGILLAASGAAICAQALDTAFGIAVFKLRGYGNPRNVIKELGPLFLASVPLYAPVVALLVYGYEEVSPLVLPLFLAPALAAQRSFVLYQAERALTRDLAVANDDLERANLSFASALVATLDARDRYTAGHSAAVAIYARDIAMRLGLSERDQQLAHLCGLVHDIGKVGLPVGLLEKPGALTLDERRQMEEHCVIGERILTRVANYSHIARIVRHHHERFDGHGYPDGVCGEDIPLISRIIAVADAYNAMTSDRPYRDAMPDRVARLRLAQAADSQFDTRVVVAFEAILADAAESYKVGAHEDFDVAISKADSGIVRLAGASQGAA